MAYPSVSYLPTSPFLGLQPIAESSATQNHLLGTLVKAADVTYGEAQFIYLEGVASTAAGDFCFFDAKAATSARGVHAGASSSGPGAVAMSANLAGRFGWYCVSGSVPVKSGSVAANAAAYLTSTAGQLDDAAVAGDRIDGIYFKAADSGGFATCQLSAPCLSNDNTFTSGITLSATNASGTPGAATINKPEGQVAIAAGAASVVVTNSLVAATSVVLCSLQTVDGTLTTLLTVVPGAGSFTIAGNANATAATKVGFVVFN